MNVATSLKKTLKLAMRKRKKLKGTRAFVAAAAKLLTARKGDADD